MGRGKGGKRASGLGRCRCCCYSCIGEGWLGGLVRGGLGTWDRGIEGRGGELT